MNRYILITLLSLCLLAACSPRVSQNSADIAGDWSITLTVTESSREDVKVGETSTSTITFSVSGAEVTATSPNGTTSTGTRSGNTVTLSRTGGDGADAFSSVSNLTFSENKVSGEATQTFENGDAVTRTVSGTRQE